MHNYILDKYKIIYFFIYFNYKMYENYYYNIIQKIINTSNDNSNILIYFNNFYNILTDFNYIIKKKNLTIYLYSENETIKTRIKDEKLGEELEDKIIIIDNNTNTNTNTNTNIIYDHIIIFHLYDLIEFTEKLQYIKIFLNEYSKIHIYCSLSNEKKQQIDYKNNIRNKIKKYIDYSIGNLLSFTDILETIKTNKYKVNEISLYKKNHYIIYGDNLVYKINLSYELI